MKKFLMLFSLAACLLAQDVKVGGKWQLTIETPHGTMPGTLTLQQQGAKVSGTCDVEHIGSFPLTGTVEGKAISMTLDMQEQQMKVAMTGSVDGNSMSGTTEFGKWSATRATVMGAVTKFNVDALQIGMQTDSGEALLFKVGPQTQVVQVAPGERDLRNGKPAKVADLLLGDRIMVTFVDGLDEARRIVLMASDDVTRRNELERADWQRRGVSGTLVKAGPEEITVEVRNAKGPVRKTVTVTSKTVIRRYAPNSVKFTEAVPGSLEEMRAGDQVTFRGEPKAEEIVFGTFETHVGKVTAVNPEAGDIHIQDLATKQALTVHLTGDSRIRLMPDMKKMMAGHGGAGHEPATPQDLAQMMDRLPTGKIDSIKAGGAVIVSSTRSTAPDRVTAILLLANADSLLEMAQAQAANGGSPIDALGNLHGGMMRGPGGLNLPGMMH